MRREGGQEKEMSTEREGEMREGVEGRGKKERDIRAYITHVY